MVSLPQLGLESPLLFFGKRRVAHGVLSLGLGGQRVPRDFCWAGAEGVFVFPVLGRVPRAAENIPGDFRRAYFGAGGLKECARRGGDTVSRFLFWVFFSRFS